MEVPYSFVQFLQSGSNVYTVTKDSEIHATLDADSSNDDWSRMDAYAYANGCESGTLTLGVELRQ